MKIYRVEDKNGFGCYRDNNIRFLRNMRIRHDKDLEKYPTPKLDLGIERFIEINEICGFIDLRQAKQWFSKYELKKLAEYGFSLKKVEVKEITAIGQKQVLAIR